MSHERKESGRWRSELVAAAAVTLMSVPQGVAYAMIAGLPPAMGLYAGALPAVFGSLFRSSRHVVSGPTNAVSLLIATSVAGRMDDPVAAAATLALMVGVIQLVAGVARLGAIVDFVSTPVVLGYIVGAGTLILVGQLPNITGTPGAHGHIVARLATWVGGLGGTDALSVVLGVGTASTIVVLRKRLPRGVGAMIAMVAGGLLVWVTGAEGIRLASDLASTPHGLPHLSLPSLSGMGTLLPVAVAAAVLSLVESTSVARAIASRTGQHLDLSREMAGQGIANLASAVSGGFVVSGSPSRSTLNERSGAQTRWAGALSGVLVLAVVAVAGPVVDHIPIPSLAGLLVVVSADLVEIDRLRALFRSRPSDVAAFLATVAGTWFLPLDQAIYLGVGISLVTFLRRARTLLVRELLVDRDLHLHEWPLGEPAPERLSRCKAIRFLHIEGRLFFANANELRDAMVDVMSDPEVKVLIVRLKRAQGGDFTVMDVLADARDAMEDEGRHLLLVGMRPRLMDRLEKIGITEDFGDDHIYPTRPGWFTAMNEATAYALDLVGDCPHHCEDCVVARYVGHRKEVVRSAR